MHPLVACARLAPRSLDKQIAIAEFRQVEQLRVVCPQITQHP